MQIPLQVTFEGSDPSEPVRVAIEREVERLEKHNRHIIRSSRCCNCTQSQTPSRQWIPFHISLTVSPRQNVIVNHAASDDSRTNMLRWQSKTHLPPPDGNSTSSRSKNNVMQRQEFELCRTKCHPYRLPVAASTIRRRNPEVSKDDKLVKHEHHPNSPEDGDTANIKQNTTSEGYFRGRRQS